MITLSATTTLDQKTATEAVTDAIESLGGSVLGTEQWLHAATEFRFAIPAMGIPALPAFLGAAGLELDEESAVGLGGIAATVLITTIHGTLRVRYVEERDEGMGNGE